MIAVFCSRFVEPASQYSTQRLTFAPARGAPLRASVTQASVFVGEVRVTIAASVTRTSSRALFRSGLRFEKPRAGR